MEIHRSFKIPLKARRPSEDCQYTLPADSREAKEIEYAIKRQTWDINDLDRAVSISLIKKVDNPSLEKEYREKKSQLREEGRSTKELSQQLAFCLETDDSRVKEICQIGLECCGTDHTLGDGGMGVTVWRCPDLCIRAFSWPASGSAFLLVFKIVKGRVKPVTPRVSPGTPNLEPTPNHDCHISRNTVSSSVTDLTTLLRNTQYYLYEYDDEGLPSKRPRHCLPFAVVPLKRNEMASPRSPKRPLAFIEIPVSPAKQLTKHAEELKAPSFADDDGILVWRGLVTSGNRSLGRVSLLAGHKLGVNFWKSYLDVSRKIPLRQLGLMLPGDVKNGWKWPLLYRNCALSVCTVKQAQGEACEALKSFTRHLVTKAKSAGVLCIDSITTMFLLPSGKLAIHLGFCETEMPPRLFCIVCRRHASPLMLKSACGYSTFRPYSSTTVNNEATAIDPSSFNFKTRYTSKIIVSSTENSRRLDPKLTPPRQTLKRSLSFSYSPAKVAKKGLQRVVRSASSSVGVSSKEETPIRPAILPILEVSCDGSRRKDNCVWENSCAWDNKSQIAAGSSHISFNSLADGEKFEEGNSYMDSEKTIILEGSTKNLLTLKTSPTVSKNATLSYLQSEERSCQSLQLSEEQVTCNTSPNLEADELASSTDYPLLSPHSRQIWVKTRESLSKPSLVEVTLQESTYAQSGPQSATAVLRDGDLSLRSTNANDWALQSSRLASTPSSLAQPTVQASIQKSSYKENEHRFSVTDESESETSLRSDSQAHLPVRWSGVTETSSKVPGGSDRNFCVREMTASSSSNRKHCNVAESSTSRSELVFECPRGKMKESGVIPLCGENVSSSCSRESHDHPQLIFPGQNCIPFLWCGSDDSPSQKEDTVASRKGFLVHPGMNGSCSGLSNVSADKKTFFCVDVEKDLEGPLDKLEVQSSCLRGDGLNPIPPANVPQENYNSEMYDSLEIVDMEISDSSTDLNNEDASHNLKVAADLSENFPLCTDGDLHDNLETVDMEMSKTSNFETLHLNDGVFLNSTSIEASLTEIPCTGCEDKRERVNVEISDLTPDQTVSSQPYSYVPLTDCYDSPRNHLNGSSKTHDSIGLHKRVNDEEQRLSQTMLASFPRTGLVLNSAFLEPSCLVSSLPSTSRENTFETIGGNATEQTKSSSMDPSVTTAISTTRESTLESQDVTKPIDMDISDDSEVITVSCEKDNNGGYRLEVFCNLSKKDHSQSQDTNSNTQISAKVWEETVEETAEETAEDTVSLGVTSDHPKFTSQERSSSFSSTSLLREHGTCSSITEELHQAIEHSVPSASASDTQPQNSFPKEQESKCGAVFTYGQVSSFSLSPPKSPKVSVRKLKILQAAFKAETDISGFTSDSRTTPSSPANVVKYISHKSSFHSTVKHCKESCAETSESSDCTGVQNSSGSSAKGCKTPVMSSTAFEKEVTVVPEQKGVCRGGVIEMSLIEDWGFHTSDSDCSERQLTVDGRCQPQTGEGDDLYTLDAHKTFQTSETCPVIEDNDFPEPETVVCSPVAPSEAFNSEFIGESGFRYPSAGDRKTTAAEEETSLTQRFRGDLPELMRSSDVKPATMLSPSKPSPAEEYSENVTAINERDSKESSTIVPQLASDMDSAPDVPKACPTTECSETGGFKIEWSHTEISIGDSLVSDDDVSVAGSSRERTQKYSGASESVNTNRVLKIPVARSGMVVEPRSSEEVQDTILLETLGASYLPVSGTHSSKAEKIGMETVPLSGSTIRFDNLSCTGEGKIMEAEVSSTVAHKNEGCPKLVAQESVISFPGQVNEEILSDGKKDRDSFWELLDEEHATDLAGEEERKNCSLKVPVEEEKLNAEDRAAATETKYAIVDCSVPGKEIAESVNSTQNTEAVMPASLQDIGRKDCQEFSDVTTSTAAKGRESHLESRAGKRMFDHVSDDRTMQTARRIEEYADCSRAESRVVSTKAESMAGIRTITSKRRSEVSSESFSTIPQKAKPGERTVEPVLKWDIRCKTEQLSSKTTSGSGKAAKDRKPSDRISKSEKTQTCDEINSESSFIKDRPCLNSLRLGFAAAEGRILDERTVREGDIKSRKSAEIKTCTSSKRGQSSIDSEGSSIGDNRNSNRYAYSSKRAPPLYSTGTPHAYKELEVRARQEKCTNDDFSALYRDTRGRTESLKDTNHLQRENMVQYTKKVPWEPDQWAVHKLGRKRQKMTPPPPLISLERGFRHGQDPHQRWGEGEASNGHNHFYPPCCGQPKNLFPRVDYITEQQCSRMVWKHRSYPCWVSPQLSLPPVTNKGRAILHHLIPDYPRWYPEGTFSLNDPRIGQNQFEQVYQGSLVHGKPVCVPSPGRGQSVLAAPPPLIPGLWAMPAIPCHQPYPVYRPR